MKVIFAVAASLLLAGCESAADRDLREARDDFQYLKEHSGSNADICAAARRLVDAQMKARASDSDYLIAKVDRDTACLNY